MSEQLIKTPVQLFDHTNSIYDADGNQILFVDNREQLEYIATCINDHTALVAIAEAAEKHFDGSPRICANCPHPDYTHYLYRCEGLITKPNDTGDECPCDGFVSKLEQKLSAWRKG